MSALNHTTVSLHEKGIEENYTNFHVNEKIAYTTEVLPTKLVDNRLENEGILFLSVHFDEHVTLGTNAASLDHISVSDSGNDLEAKRLIF